MLSAAKLVTAKIAKKIREGREDCFATGAAVAGYSGALNFYDPQDSRFLDFARLPEKRAILLRSK
jgi:hypothetical protein